MNSKLSGFLFLALGLFAFWSMEKTDYMRYQWRDVCVVKKFESSHTHKSRKIIDYNFSLDMSGRKFNYDVSRELYYSKNQGSCFKFNLREFDIEQTPKDNILYFFIPGFLVGIFLSFGLTFLFFEPLLTVGRRED